MGSLEGRIAVVTGGGRGLGRAHALLMASEGAKVVVNDLGSDLDGLGADPGPAQSVVEEIKSAGGEAVANTDSVTDWEGARRMVRAAVETFGDLHVLVNNAGIGYGRQLLRLEEIDEGAWDTMIGIHVKGHFNVLHHAAEYWRDRAQAGGEVRGSVINTSSPAGFVQASGTQSTQLDYAVAKAGILAMTSAAAVELSRYGVRVNAIAPGARTRMSERAMPEVVAAPGDPAAFDTFDPGHVSPVVAWLASDRCRVTGQVFKIFGSAIEVYRGWTPVGMIDKDRRWSIDELDVELDRLVNQSQTVA
ncbi:MAG: SDR family NAD(P)-dependent oxidoreductase [Acidimicrobiaceae bacterium]|nr:SDR family NAD(P)-dependent oxidoreductase [Acidimicrobiaceae bacterium]